MSTYTQKQVADLVDGKLEWNTVHRMLSMPKDAQRFELFLKVLQARVPWDDAIVLPLGPHLFIAQDKATKQWVNKSCLRRLPSELETRRTRLRARQRAELQRGLSETHGARSGLAGLSRILLPGLRRSARC